MQTINTQFAVELGKLIDEDIERLRENVCAGGAVKDIADYRYLTGQIFGLARAKSFFDEVNTLLSKR